MTICGMAVRYHGSCGTSRGYLLVRHGARNSVLLFLPAMPPNTVRGMVMTHQMRMMMTIVPKGSAAVDFGRTNKGGEGEQQVDGSRWRFNKVQEARQGGVRGRLQACPVCVDARARARARACVRACVRAC
eukprot:3684-Chlamydomonas_euryale.AAC.2